MWYSKSFTFAFCIDSANYASVTSITYHKAPKVWSGPQHLLEGLRESLPELCQQLGEGEAISGHKPLFKAILQHISTPLGENIVTL